MTNFWNDLTANTVITASITLLAFIFGFIIQQLIENKKERNRLNKLERYFYTGIEYIRAAVLEQIEFYKELSININDLSQHEYSYLERTRLYLDNINFISDIDFYDIFITNKPVKKFPEKLKNFHHLNNSILFIPHQNKSSKDSFEKFQNKTMKIDQQWFESTNILINTVERIMCENETAVNLKDMQKSISSLYLKVNLNQELKNIQHLNDQFIKPLISICYNYVNTSYYNQLMPILRKLSSVYSTIIATRNFYSKKFRNDAEKLQKKVLILEEAVYYFNRNQKLDTSLNIV